MTPETWRRWQDIMKLTQGCRWRPKVVAQKLGISWGNLRVIVYRARHETISLHCNNFSVAPKNIPR